MTKVPFTLKPAAAPPRVVPNSRGKVSLRPSAQRITKVRSTQHVGRHGGRPPGL